MRSDATETRRAGRGPGILASPLALALFGACACGPSVPSVPAAGPSRPPALLVSGDTAGWIVPCGCTANQSGGLLRRGSFVRSARLHRDVILADAGGAPGGTSPYDRLKFEAILAGERAMGGAAHNLGAPEAALGAGYLRDVRRRLDVPFVSANLRDEAGTLIAAPRIEVAAGGVRVVLVGVVSPRLVGGGLKADEPRDAVLKAVEGLSFDALVVLAYLPEPELRRLAADLPEADVVVGGPTGQSIAPTRVGPAWLASATNKGKFLIRMDRAPAGATWTGEVVEMTPAIADDPAQRANLDRFRAELAARDLPADQTGLAPRLPSDLPSTYALAGTESCRDCHREDCASWTETRHAHAWQTLLGRGDHVDPQCQSCHTTGYGLPGGFRSVARSPDRTSVGCESCHGPSRGHVALPSTRTPFSAKGQCLSCHDRENSPSFDLAAYWQKIRHGAASRDPARRVEGRP